AFVPAGQSSHKTAKIDILAECTRVQVERRALGESHVYVTFHGLQCVRAAFVQLSIEVDVSARHLHVERRTADSHQVHIAVNRRDAYVARQGFYFDVSEKVAERK